jgi:hypothetical protein
MLTLPHTLHLKSHIHTYIAVCRTCCCLLINSMVYSIEDQFGAYAYTVDPKHHSGLFSVAVGWDPTFGKAVIGVRTIDIDNTKCDKFSIANQLVYNNITVIDL